jgi:hypothetical protein
MTTLNIKKLISFDVGIKNMAYCIFDIDLSNNPFSIKEWKIMNMLETESQEITKTCNCEITIKKKGNPLETKICGKTAKYFKNNIEDTFGNKYYCLTHSKNSNYIIPNESFYQKTLKKKSLEELIEFSKKFEIQTSEWKTKKKALETLDTFFNERCLEILKKTKKIKAGEIDLISLGHNMKNLLNQIPNIHDIDHIIIENQISPIANRMKTIQGMLAQYFIMTTPNANIVFVSSANKLKQFQKSQTISNNATSSDYKQHKLDGVYFTKTILQNNHFLTKWENILETKKKDDLADCFLQGIWYLYSKKIIYYAENLKINSV